MNKITEALLKSLNTIAFKFSIDVPNLSGLTDEGIDKAMNEFTERIIQGMNDNEDKSFQNGLDAGTDMLREC